MADQKDNDTPSTEELAKELAATETVAGMKSAGNDTPETAPDPEPASDAPAETPSEAAASAHESPADSPAPEAKQTPEPREIAPPSSTQGDKKAADTKRRKRVIAKTERPDLVDTKEEKRKNEIREEMEAVTRERDEFLIEAQGCQDQLTELSAKLYPHAVKSDSLVDAVRGHIKAQKKIRANRASNPERIKEILKAAGRAPIDAAFHRQRARGMKRPTRTPMTAKKPAGDKAPGAGSHGKAAE